MNRAEFVEGLRYVLQQHERAMLNRMAFSASGDSDALRTANHYETLMIEGASKLALIIEERGSSHPSERCGLHTEVKPPSPESSCGENGSVRRGEGNSLDDVTDPRVVSPFGCYKGENLVWPGG